MAGTTGRVAAEASAAEGAADEAEVGIEMSDGVTSHSQRTSAIMASSGKREATTKGTTAERPRRSSRNVTLREAEHELTLHSQPALSAPFWHGRRLLQVNGFYPLLSLGWD